MNDDVSQRSRGIKTCNPGHAHRLTIAASLLLQRTISPCRSPSLCVLMSVSLPLSLSNTFHQISSGEQIPSGFFKTWVLSGKSGPRFFFPPVMNGTIVIEGCVICGSKMADRIDYQQAFCSVLDDIGFYQKNKDRTTGSHLMSVLPSPSSPSNL